MFKKFRSDKINGTKNAIFFLSLAQTHHTSAFNLRLLRGKAQCLSLSKTVFKSVFDSILLLLKFAFLFSKMHGIFWLQNVIIPFKIKIKVTHGFQPKPLFFCCNKKFSNSVISACIGTPQKLGRGFYKFFKKYFVAQETIDLNISVFLVSYLRLACSSISR